MRRLAGIGIAVVSLLAITGTASAADLPAKVYTKAPPIIAPVWNWGGFYVGLNGGGASSHNCWTGGVPVATGLGCHDATGGVAGGQIGYRWQMTNWVFGLEAQGDWANLKGSNTSAIGLFGGVPFLNQTKIDSLGLFTGQVGYAWNNVLAYVKGGAAVTDNRYDGLATVSGIVTDTAGSNTKWGGTVGAGIEYGFAPNWSFAVEYDHLFMGTDNYAFNTAGLATRNESIKQDADLVTVRLNYRFGGPVVARY